MIKKAELEVLRCCDCQDLNTNREIKQYGMCKSCGCKKMKNVLILDSKEAAALKKKGVSDDFFKLFEGAAEWVKK